MTTATQRAELLEKLTTGISSLTTSVEWQRYLDVQSRFHRYSYGNVLLIAAQRPGATRVAGFAAWKGLHRAVRRGESAVWILAPVAGRPTGPAGGGGGEEGDEKEVGAGRKVRGFRWVAVFDVAQTEGDDLPAACHRLEGDDPAGHLARLEAAARSFGFAVVDHHFASTTNGDCDHAERRIRIEAANRPAQRVKTLAHEIAHALLHQGFASRAIAELEAESTAYIVCQALGIDSGVYSFGYVATWAGDTEAAQVQIRSSCCRIQKAAATILSACEPGDDQAAP